MSSDLSVKTYSPEYDYPITTPSGRVVHPPPVRCWFTSKQKMQELIADNRIWFGPDGNSVPRLKRFLSETKQGVTPLTIWTYKEVGHNQEGKQELKGMLSESDEVFGTPKPTRLLGRVITIGTSGENNALILDFFAGSGTTGHAVINLNREDGGRRKYILVEMADYFHTVLLPRIKKVVFSDKWREGKAQPDGQGISHFVKYYELEQYEDTLRQTRYLDNDLFTLPATEDPCQYLFLPDPKMLKALKMNLKQGTVKVDLSKLYEDIDLAETLSNLTGKWLRRIHPDPDDPTKPGQVELADGTTADLKNPDWRLIKPLIWW